VEARIRKEGDAFVIDRSVAVNGSVSEEQRERLAEICEKTPVTLLLKQGAVIGTTLRSG